MTPNAPTSKPKEPPVTRTVFNLDTMEEVTLQKQVDFTPVSTMEDAVKMLGGDANKLLEVINTGLRTELRNAAIDNDDIPWMIEVENKDGSTSVVPFEGTPADNAVVNNLRLSLAKSVYDYNKYSGKTDADAAGRKKAKEDALEFIRTNPTIRERLKANAMPKVSEQ